MRPLKLTAVVALLALCASASFADDAAPAYPTFTSAICEDRGVYVDPHFTNQTKIDLGGTASPDWALSVFDRGVLIANPVPAADGTWQWSASFAEGNHHLDIYATDGSGAQIGPDVCNFTVDLTPPDAPTPQGQDGAVVPPVGTYEGFGEPGQVLVYEKSSLLANQPTDGVFHVRLTLLNGPHTLSFFAVDRAGNKSATAGTLRVDVDGIAPTLSIAMENNHIFAPFERVEFIGDAGDDRQVSRVAMRYFDVTGKTIAMHDAICDDCPSGKASAWMDTMDLLPGAYRLEAFSYDGVGNRSAMARLSFVVL